MNVFSDTIITSLCWTLLHSLWQAALIALLTGMLMQAMKNSNANARYNVLVGALVLFLLGSTYTFYTYIGVETTTDIAINTPYDALPSTATIEAQAMSSAFDITTFINANVNYFVGLWFMFFIIRLVHLSRQALQVSRLQHFGLVSLPDAWQEKTHALASALSLHKKYTVALSSLVNTPVVIGIVKPTLLLPISILNGLPQDQLEAILLHELAHIKRNDYFFNLLQRTIELAFFFNPGLMWLSAAIDDEREHACDEMALAIHNDKHSFINALLGCNEYMTTNNKLALGFGNNKKYLLSRATRILTNQYDGLAKYDKTIMALCLLITSVPVIHQCTNDDASVATSYISSIEAPFTTDTVPANLDGLKILEEIHQVQSESSALSKTGVKLDEAHGKKLLQLQDRLIHLQNKLNLLNEAKFYDINAKAQSYHIYSDSTMSVLANEEVKLQAQSIKLDAEARLLQIEAVKMEAEAQRMEQDELRMQEDAKRMAADELRMAADEKRMAENEKRMQNDELRMKADAKRMEEDAKRMEEDAKRMEEDSKRMEEESKYIEQRTKGIAEEMIKDNIITSQNNLSFSLSKHELIVNGKKQSDEMAKKYYNKFGFKGGTVLHNFNVETKKK